MLHWPYLAYRKCQALQYFDVKFVPFFGRQASSLATFQNYIALEALSSLSSMSLTGSLFELFCSVVNLQGFHLRVSIQTIMSHLPDVKADFGSTSQCSDGQLDSCCLLNLDFVSLNLW